MPSVRAYKEMRYGTRVWANRAAFSKATVLFRFRKIDNIKIDTSHVIVCDAGMYMGYFVMKIRSAEQFKSGAGNMNINPKIEEMFKGFKMDGKRVPISYLQYFGTDDIYLTYYTWKEKPQFFFDDDVKQFNFYSSRLK